MTAQAALERLRASARPRVLLVSHAQGGGVARHIAALAAAIAADAEVLLLEPAGESAIALRELGADDALALWFQVPAEWEAAAALLDGIGIDRVHFHHVHGLPREVLGLPARLGAAHDVTLHDYFPACPAYHMTDACGAWCGGEPQCQRCLEAGPAQWPLSIDEWRHAFGALLAAAQRVIAPSADAAQRIRRFFPNVAPVTWPHIDALRAEAPAMRVLVPGALSEAKGLDVLAACVRDAAERALPLHFRVLGYVAHPVGDWPRLPVSIAGEYPEGALEALIAAEGGDAFFFPAQCAETYSYTLSAALATGLPIVATNLGALPERLAGRADTRVVPWDATPAEMNDALLALAPHTAGVRAPALPGTSAEDYRARYLEGLTRRDVSRAVPPTLPSQWLVPPRHAPRLSSLAWLFEDAVRCGRGRSLEELERRVAEADRRIARAEGEARELQEARQRLGETDAALQSARAAAEREADESERLRERLARVESSRSWKLTGPLRALARRLRGEV